MNVLVSDDGRALIGDFGLSYIAVASAMASSSGLERGTARWAAPELLYNDARQTRQSDIWSFGCLCYEVRTLNLLKLSALICLLQVLTGKLPFNNLNDAQVVLSLAKSGDDAPLPGAVDSDDIDHKMREIIKKCWARLPSDRPTCEMVRGAIASIDIRDPRPEVIPKAQDSLSFLQAMRGDLVPQVDYNRVRDILRKVRNDRLMVYDPKCEYLTPTFSRSTRLGGKKLTDFRCLLTYPNLSYTNLLEKSCSRSDKE